MASYDYRCRICDSTFTEQRSMSAVATAVRCPHGHDDVHRVWSAISVARGGDGVSMPAPQQRQGGCCGGACGCG